jgi:hypothetical protein
VVVAVAGRVQEVQVAQVVVETAVAMRPLAEQLVRSIWAVAAAVAVQIAQAAVKLSLVALAVQALQLCKSKHRCTPEQQLAHLLLRLQVHLQL